MAMDQSCYESTEWPGRSQGFSGLLHLRPACPRSGLLRERRAGEDSTATPRTLIGSAGEAVRLHAPRIKRALVSVLPREERQPSRVALGCSSCVALTLVHRALQGDIVAISAYRDPACWRFRGVGGATNAKGCSDNNARHCEGHTMHHQRPLS